MAISRLTQTSLQNAFQKYNSVWDGTSAAGAMDTLGAVTLTATQSSITFSSIPQTYSHLQVRFLTSASYTTNPPFNFLVKFNNDSSAIYSRHRLHGDGSSATSYGIGSQTFFELGYLNGSATTMNAGILDILDYANTSKYKTARALSGYDANGSGTIAFNSGSYQSTSGITTISFTNNSGSGNNFATYSSFALYGIK